MITLFNRSVQNCAIRVTYNILSAFEIHVAAQSAKWIALIETSVTQYRELLVIFYENLQMHLIRELTDVARFLGVEVDQARLECVAKDSTGSFKRKPRKLPADIFTQSEKYQITSMMKHADKIFRLMGVKNIPRFYGNYSVLDMQQGS